MSQPREHDAWWMLALAFLILPITILGVCVLCAIGDDR